MTSEHQYRKRLDSLLEGIQIIDADWRYVYLNDVMSVQARQPKEELLGYTMMEKYPGIEQTELFTILQKTMKDRQPRRMENEFTFPDHSVRWFELGIFPDEDGICILSLDITQHKESEAKINKGKNLYAFLSHINQSIVHIKNKKELFKNVCQIAIRFGGFKMAWIGMFDRPSHTISLIDQCDVPEADIPLLTNLLITAESPQQYVIDHRSYFVCNDLQAEIRHEVLREFAERHGIFSLVVLPLFQSGTVVGTLNLYSDKPNFTGQDEIMLFEEVITDLSFALDNYEKEKKHRETEMLLIENEKRFRALIEKSTDMKTLADAEGKLFYGSPSVSKVLGYDRDQMKYASVFDFIHPDDIPQFVENRTKIAQKPGETFEFEMRMKHADGHWIWTEGTVTNMLKESGVQGLVSNFRDITEKKIAQQQQEFDRKNMQALIDNTTELMWSVDKNLRLIASNKPFDDLMRRTLGRKISEGESILHEKIDDGRLEIFHQLYDRALQGEAFTETVSVALPKGNWSEISFYPILSDGKIIGTACHSRDITKRIESEIQLENQNRELIKANFELDRFVYSVSHDLRSPLTSIMGLLTLMEEDLDPQAFEHIQMIRSRVNRLDSFIKNILNYSRTKRTQIVIEPIALTEMTTEIVESLSGIKAAKHLHFEIDFDEQIPFYSDRQSVATVLENIISNAIKFHAKDRHDSYIRIKGKTTKNNLSLTIADNGIGIASHLKDRVFDMFYRASAVAEGTGLGLYIVREIVNKLEGTISITSEENQGALFRIRLKNYDHEHDTLSESNDHR